MDTPTISIVREDGRGSQNPVFSIDGNPWGLERDGLEGFDGIEATFSTQDYAQYDGAYLLSERAPSVDRTIQCAAQGDIAALRSQAEAFFIPHRDYTVHVVAEGRRRFFRGRHYMSALMTDNRRSVQRLTWTVLALDPYLYSEESNSFNLVEGRAKRGFPFLSFDHRAAPVPENSASGSARAGTELHIAGFVVSVMSRSIRMSNGGSSVTYPRFDISASGEVRDPEVRIIDATGAEVCRFGVHVTLGDGDLLVVDFSARPTTITLNGDNVSNLATSGSTLATGIEQGEFTLEWSAAFGDAAMSVVPTIRDRYASI